MIPYIQYGLGIRDDRVELRYQNTAKGKQLRRVITSVKDFQQFIIDRCKKAKVKPDDLIVMCSSSMDFPEDSTSNKKTIALARALR